MVDNESIFQGILLSQSWPLERDNCSISLLHFFSWLHERESLVAIVPLQAGGNAFA